ncbi:MAG: hypothetical protein ACTHYO_10465 [Micrococcaceae bacterium]
MNTEIRYRVNRRIFMQYYRQAKTDLATGRKKSERYMAAEIGISHTQLRALRRGMDSSGRTKVTVNLATARLIEHKWDLPPDVAFVPDVLGATSSSSTPAHAA